MKKFKVWNESLKKWVANDICYLRGSGEIFFWQDGKLSFAAPHYKAVFSTGLHDKNGKEIWEGDIVRVFSIFTKPVSGHVYYGDSRVSKVSFSNGQFMCGYQGISAYTVYKSGKNHNELEVLGNIYSNPELLK